MATNISLPAAPTSNPESPLPTVSGSPGDKFTFTNNTGVAQTFTPASCMSPNQTDSLTTSGDDQTSRKYTINSRTAAGDYDYSIDDGNGGAGMRSGTIVVS